MQFVGKNHPIHDAKGKVTGRTQYAADISLPKMAHIAMIFSTVPHGYVQKIDASAALAVEGVYGVFHHENTPKVQFNRFRSQFAQVLPLEEYAFQRHVRFVGDRVAAVAAKDLDTARRAAALVEITYETLPHATTFEEALEGKNCLEGETPIKDEYTMDVGTPPRLEGDFVEVVARTELGRLHHAAMETHVCVADYDPSSDELTLHSPNQAVHGIRTVVADMLEMPYSRVRVVKTTMGGSFGGKQEWFLEPVAAVLARELKRPVKLVYDRSATMRSTVCRGAMRGVLRGTFRPDGTLMAIDFDLLTDAGAYIGNTTAYVRTFFGKFFRCYRLPYAIMHSAVVCTNTPVAGSFRGWSAPEQALMMEHLFEKAASTLGIDPVELRLKNVLLPGDIDPKIQLPVEEVRTRECLIQGAEQFRWAEKRRADAAFNLENHRYRRGTAVACGGHGNTYYPRFNDFAGVALRMHEDGTVLANMSVHDHGCGSVTAFKLIIAEALELEPQFIRLTEADTAHSPFDYGCYSSRSIFVIGRAAQRCAENLRAEMLTCGAQLLNRPVDDLYFEHAILCSHSDETVAMTYKALSHGTLLQLRKEIFANEQYCNHSNPAVTGTHFAHVEVDSWTGLTKVLDYLALHDIGQAINPAMCIAQIQGAVQMGAGAALREDMTISSDGRAVNSLAKYHLMNAPDLPEIQVVLLQDGTSQEGPFGAKSIGEVSFLPPAPAVAGAVNQALGSDMEVIPMTPDRILDYLSKEGC